MIKLNNNNNNNKKLLVVIMVICLMLYIGWLKLFRAKGDIFKGVYLFKCLLNINNFLFKIYFSYILMFLSRIFVLQSVGTRFVADRNSVGFARKTALTISFVERGFERLGLDR